MPFNVAISWPVSHMEKIGVVLFVFNMNLKIDTYFKVFTIGRHWGVIVYQTRHCCVCSVVSISTRFNCWEKYCCKMPANRYDRTTKPTLIRQHHSSRRKIDLEWVSECVSNTCKRPISWSISTCYYIARCKYHYIPVSWAAHAINTHSLIGFMSRLS